MLSRDSQRLMHILDYCDDIENHLATVNHDHPTFLTNSMCQHSIAFCILQIGELTVKLSDELRSSTSQQINWTAIKGMRNIVVHDYGHIDLDVVWSVATEDIPTLKTFCQTQLEQNSPS